MQHFLRKQIVALALAVAVFSVAGCMGVQEIAYTRIETVPDNKAVVYFYRPMNFVNSAKQFNILVNGDNAGALYNKGYFPYEAMPGDVEIELKDAVFPYAVYGSLNLHLKPGQTYFVKYGPDSALGKFKFRLMDPALGEDEIRGCAWFKRTDG